MSDPRKYVAGSSSLVLGCDSYTQSAELGDQELVMGQNIVVRGGIAQTRPGTRTVFCLPDGNFQGVTMFTPANGVAQLVFAVEGKIYVSPAPFTSYRRLQNLQFSNTARFVSWASCLKSTDYDANGDLIFIDNPYSVLVIQDGLTRAGYWDGSNSAHLNPSPAPDDVTDVTDSSLPGYDETPIGLWMIWSGNRLWVSRNNQIFASDIGNPLKFTETDYLNEGRAFYLSSPCTGMIEVPSGTGEDKGFIAFTENDGTLFQSYVQKRTDWLNTPLFQNTILPNIGCVAPRSLITQYGLNWWFSSRGLTNMNAAFRQNLSSRIDYQDNQMFSSKAYIGPDLSGVCGSYYENYLMMSVPFCDVLNRHTWVLDQAPFEGNANAWTGFWSGWRPIEWTRGIVNGDERIFFGSVDYDGKNRIWEGMLADRRDNGCAITCCAQLRDHAAGNLDQKRYEWSKFFLSQILGEVDLNVYVASTKGGYQLQKEYRLVATEGQVFGDVQYSEAGPLLVANRVQSRVIRTPSDPEDDECNACEVESKVGNMIDYAFSHLLVWSGQMGVRAYQMHMRESPDRNAGDCEEPEVGPRTLNASGCSGLELLVDTDVFEEFTGYAEGTAVTLNGAMIYIRREEVSVISQAAADRLAACAVAQIQNLLNGTDIAAGVYNGTEAEVGSGTYVIVRPEPPDVSDEPPPVDERARVLIHGGGGGGAIGGGGGGDGEEYLNVVIPAGTNPVVIGAGGALAGASVAGPKGGTGGTTTFLGYSKTGGGGGGNTGVNGNQNGNAGASGGGGGAYDGGTSLGGVGAPGGNGGTNGGFTGAPYPAGGGGGRGGPGTNAPSGVLAGSGGPGFTSDISGASLGYCGGGGAQCYLGGGAGSGSDGGSNGSPAGSALPGQRGGGGGGTGNGSNGGAGSPGGLIVRYVGAPRFTGGVITTVGGDTVHTFATAGIFSLDSI